MNKKRQIETIVDQMLGMMTVFLANARKAMHAHRDMHANFQRLFVLHSLDAKGSLSLTDFSETIHFKKNALSQLLDRMHDDGLIRRGDDLHDRRKVIFYITPAGKDSLTRMMDLQVAFVAKKVASLSDAEVNELICAQEAAIQAFQTIHRLSQKCEGASKEDHP